MKKLICYLLIFAAMAGCQPKTSQLIPLDPTQPELLPVPSFGANHQAPFGYDTVKVKLRELFYDGKLTSQFYYKNGYLTEVVDYVTYNQVKPWRTASYNRIKGVPDQYEFRLSTPTPDGTTVPDLPEKGKVGRYLRAESETVRSVVEVYGSTSEYFLNSKGFVAQAKRATDTFTNEQMVITYKRDATNNIAESIGEFTRNSYPIEKKTYKHDNHPNPFYDLGIDRSGKIPEFSLSPNNVVEERGFGAINHKGESVDALIHEYEYLPNGYPMKDTTYYMENGADGTTKKVVLNVMDYRYY